MGTTHTVSFPGLGIGEFSVNEVAFTIFGIDIKWYALIITVGIVLAVVYTMFRASKVGITSSDILDYAIFTVPIGIIGARLYYVLTTLGEGRYNSFLDVINIRNGGLAIYGGIIAGAITVFVVSKVKKIPFRVLGDCISPGLILAQAIGRWGNFMNVEAYGSVTSAPWRMCSPKIARELKNLISTAEYEGILNGTLGVHPCFFYESLWNIIGVILINIFYKKRKYDGQVMVAVFGWYGLGRMFIEGLRTDSLWIGPFGILQLIFGILLICAACVILWFYKDIVKLFKKEELDPRARIISYSSLATAAVSVLMIILDTALIKSVAVIPEQRISQVLGGAIFVVCLGALIYLGVKKYDKPFFKREMEEKKK